MKKLIAIITAAILGLAALCAVAGAEDFKPFAEEHPEALKYESNWITEDAAYRMESYCRADGFDIVVVQPTGEHQHTSWEYHLPAYDEATGTLKATGIGMKSTNTTDDKGMITDSVYEYQDGSATFALNEAGRLVWTEEKEHADQPIEFIKIGLFDGIWICDRASIDIAYDSETTYSVLIHWADSATEAEDWSYVATYNQEKDALEGIGMQSHTVYDDQGEVVSVTDVTPEGIEGTFTFEGGYLRWDDPKGAGDGMLFERMDDPERGLPVWLCLYI